MNQNSKRKESLQRLNQQIRDMNKPGHQNNQASSSQKPSQQKKNDNDGQPKYDFDYLMNCLNNNLNINDAEYLPPQSSNELQDQLANIIYQHQQKQKHGDASARQIQSKQNNEGIKSNQNHSDQQPEQLQIVSQKIKIGQFNFKDDIQETQFKQQQKKEKKPPIPAQDQDNHKPNFQDISENQNDFNKIIQIDKNQKYINEINKNDLIDFSDDQDNDQYENIIQTKEQELLEKARNLEKEMEQIKQAKIDVVVKQFEQQLLKEANSEIQKFNENLRQTYDSKLHEISAEKEQSCREIENLELQLNEQIRFFGVILGQLKQKKNEVESTHQAAVHQLRNEQQQTQESQKLKFIKHVQEKRDIFRDYIKSQQM